MFRDPLWSTKGSWSRRGRVIGKAEWTGGDANPCFLVTSLKPGAWTVKPLYEELYCQRGEMENRIKEAQGNLFADRTSATTMRANQLRLWFAWMAYVLLCRDLRHDQAETAEDRRAGENQRTPGQARFRICLSGCRRMAACRGTACACSRLPA